mgnify:FL=1
MSFRFRSWMLSLVVVLAAAASGGGAENTPGGKTRAHISEDKVGTQWVSIPGGSFMMGSERYPSERPLRRVTVKPFQIARTPVTNTQYRACVKAGACAPVHVSDGKCYIFDGATWNKGSLPSSFQGDDQPVVCVDWDQAAAYSRWSGGRLPSEAEWEYAARSAGKDRPYPWGNEAATCDRAIFNEGGYGCGRKTSWPVCSKPKGNTEHGLCDMGGNVWEWVRDRFYGSHDGAPADGSAWEEFISPYRVVRGGAWNRDSTTLRTTNRDYFEPGQGVGDFGFRPARDGR